MCAEFYIIQVRLSIFMGGQICLVEVFFYVFLIAYAHITFVNAFVIDLSALNMYKQAKMLCSKFQYCVEDN